MAITAGQVTTTSTLEQFRVEFNKLQTDVSGIEAGSLSFTNISATQISVAELTVTSTLSFASFIFEGTTDDDNETTLSVIDPTADRTIKTYLMSQVQLYQQVQLRIHLLLDKHLLVLVILYLVMMNY